MRLKLALACDRPAWWRVNPFFEADRLPSQWRPVSAAKYTWHTRAIPDGTMHGDKMMTREHLRCAWAEGDALMAAYHDQEWGIPQHDPRMLWEMLMLEGFQAGLAWIIVLRKREAAI